MLFPEFICYKSRGENFIMFNFSDWVDKCLHQPEGFPLRAAITWSSSTVCIPALNYVVSYLPSTLIWINSHPITCCWIFMLLIALWTVFKYPFSVMICVVVLVVQQWTNGCLGGYCDSADGALHKAQLSRLNLELPPPSWCVLGAIRWRCGTGEKDYGEM